MSLVKTSSYPIPGLLRLRSLQPLSDREGACSLIYDLERAAVLEVPTELQLHIAPALETGDLDEDLVSWLISEDLLTSEGWDGWNADSAPYRRTVRAGRSELASLLRLEDEMHGFVDQTDETAATLGLDLIFKSGLGASRIKLHLDWGGTAPALSLVEWILIESCRRAALSGQEISYELALDAAEVTPALVHRLSGYPVHVRLRCSLDAAAAGKGTAAPPWRQAEEAVLLVLEVLADQVTVQCALAAPYRLADLWEWAKEIGVRHLDVLLEEPERDGRAILALRELRGDLLTVCQEMAAELSARRTPIDFEPLTRIVRRLIRHEAHGGILGLAGFDRTSSWLLDSVLDTGNNAFRMLSPAELEGEASGSTCQSCWARYACSHSKLVSSPIGVEDPREPSEERCSCWRAEVEAALHLFHGLAHVEPLAVLRLFDEPETATVAVDRSSWVAPIWSSKPS